MYKSSLVQLALIILGVISATKGAEVLLWHFSTIIVRGAATYYDTVTETAIVGLLSAGAYFLIAWFLIARSKQWSVSLMQITRVNPSFSIVAEPSQIIYFLLISIGVYSIMSMGPELLQKLYFEFTTTVTRISAENSYYQSRLPDWSAIIIQLLFPVLLILFARQLSNYFASKMAEDSSIKISETQPEEN